MSNTNTNTIDNSDEIILGSGDLYIVEFSGAIPEDATIEADSNRAGNIKSGATLEYSADSQTVQDDKGRVKNLTMGAGLLLSGHCTGAFLSTAPACQHS